MTAAIRAHLPTAAVFPCTPDKKPLVKWKEPWDGDIADGEPYGVPTGTRSGVWVLDLDRKGRVDGLRSITEFANGRELPDTLTVRTQSGGLHLYFTHVDGLGNRAGILPGVDVRGESGYVVGPGSPGYTVVHPGPVAPAPEWLVELAAARRATVEAFPAVAIDETSPDWPKRLELARKFLEKEPVCVEGQGGDLQLWKVAVHLTRRLQLPLTKAFELCESYNARCVPPWPAHLLMRKLEEAQTKGESPTGTVEFTDTVLEIDPEKLNPQVKNPAHKYTFDISTDLAGNQMSKLAQPDVTGCLIGSPAWGGVWQFDTFRRRMLAVNPPLRLDAEEEGYTPADNANIGLWFAAQGYDVSDTQIDKAIASAASVLRIHPVRQYLTSIPKPSLDVARTYFDGIAGRLWGATERNAIESEHLMRFAIAAVRRVMHPGTKVDTMLILTGGQGLNKSRFGLHLFGEFFSDNMPKLTSKDAMIALDGVWGLEMAELKSFQGVAEEEKRAFLTRQVDKYRPPYGKGDIIVPRQCVFYGTTNTDDFLTDATGERRYDVCEVDRSIDLTFSRDEFWGAAAVLEAHGESHFRSVEDPKFKSAAEDKLRYRHQDAWEQSITDYLAKHPDEWIRATTVLAEAIVIPLERRDDRALRRVQAILRRLLGESKCHKFGKLNHRAYWSPATSAPST